MSARSKRNTALESIPITTKRVENSWILVIKDDLFENDNFSIITLPHPAHGEHTKYCLDDVNKKIYEIVSFSEPYRSWFIGDTVKSEGSTMMVTPVNPLFLVLPRLRTQCTKRAIPLQDLLSERGFDKIIDFIPSLINIGDLKGSSDMKAYKYNEEKTLTWLEGRVKTLAKLLKEKNIHVTSGAISATFVASNIKNDQIEEEFYLKYAHGMISEYLPEDLADLLEKRFQFKPELIESLGRKRKSETGEQSEKKKSKCEPSENSFEGNSLSNIGDVKTQKPLSAKDKARLKAASGSKTLSAFFTKK